MEILLRTISDEPTIMCGDFNVNIATKNTLAKGYISKIKDYNMIQTIKTHTRITNYTETTIDHVISNQSSLTSIVTHMSLSDHQIILSFWGKSKRQGAEPSPSVHIKNIDIEKTQNKIDQIDWKPWMKDNQHSNLHPMYDSFHEKIQSCIVLKERNTKPRKTFNLSSPKKETEEGN